MPKKRFSAELIVIVLRQIEVPMSQGKTGASEILRRRRKKPLARAVEPDIELIRRE